MRDKTKIKNVVLLLSIGAWLVLYTSNIYASCGYIGCCPKGSGCTTSCACGTNCTPPSTSCVNSCKSSWDDKTPCKTGSCQFNSGCGGGGPSCSEKNKAPYTAPSEIKVKSTSDEYVQASYDANNPTRIKGTYVQTASKALMSDIGTTRGYNYKVDFELTSGIPSTDKPESNPVYINFTSSNRGEKVTFSIRNFRKNKCDSNRKYSGYLTAYFKINNLPSVVSITPQPNSSCISGNYSGKETGQTRNNPLNVRVVYQDLDEFADIDVIYLRVGNGEVLAQNLVNGMTSGSCISSTNVGCNSVTTTFSGNQITATWNVTFQTGLYDDSYTFGARAHDIMNEDGAWTDGSSWNVDLNSPTLAVSHKTVGSERIDLTWEMDDSFSGIFTTTYSVLDQGVCSDSSVSCTFNNALTPIGGTKYQGTDTVYVAPDDFEELINIDPVIRQIKDKACNEAELNKTLLDVGASWIYTLGGNVYSQLGTDLNFGQNTPFATYVCSREGGSYVINNGTVSSINKQIQISGEQSRILGEVQDIIDKLSSGEINYETVSGKIDDPGDIEYGKIYYKASGVLEISPAATSAAKKALFIAEDDIKILSGNENSTGLTYGTDDLYGFFITKKRFITENDLGNIDSGSDQLHILGTVIAIGEGSSVLSLEVKRNLGYQDNKQWAAEIIEYDPDYLEMYRDILGIVGPVQTYESGVQ